ncbi:MAG: diguanylate cyclase [Synechococcaceae cyanobacterium RL_1_2]|nr:diguanylate cyclase [Synechococcaceae cyanobacterium RL_1_2]
MLGKSEQDFFPPNEVNIFLEQDQKVLTTEQAQEHEEEFTNANGVTYLTETKRSIHKDGASNVFLIGVIRDITERKRMEEQLRRTAVELTRSNIELKESEGKLRYLANHDPLTGLANRKLFYESLASAIEWADNNKQLVGLLYLDLDGFKPVNDNLGHDMGDLLLQAVSQRIKNCLRNSDIVCRLGGDEFTVILHGIKASDHGEVVADKIQKTISQEFMIKDHSIFISTSIGISVYPQDALTQDELIKLADSAMYVAKQEGKGRFKSAQSNQSNQTSPDQP